jgi:hypothetical protein
LYLKHVFKYTVYVRTNKANPILLALTLSLPAWCGSTVTTYSGDIGFINTAPSSLVPGAVENNLKALLFMEDTDLSFDSAITVNATAPGLYKSKASLTPGSIAAGTLVSDTYIHADPVTSGTKFTGSVTFDSNILGVIVTTNDLFATDALLGVTGTNYGNVTPRGLELNPLQDYFSISTDLRTLTFTLTTWGWTDDIRVLTAGASSGTSAAQPPPASATPEPGTLALIGLGLGCVVIGARRRRPNAS